MKIDTKEFELPDTLFIRDIESKVFQTIVLQCLHRIKGIYLIEKGLSNLLGLEELQPRGIYIEQDQKNHSVNVKVEVDIAYGVPIPEKAEEIQSNITMEITKITGLHVASVHIIFKNIHFPKERNEQEEHSMIQSDYSDEF